MVQVPASHLLTPKAALEVDGSASATVVAAVAARTASSPLLLLIARPLPDPFAPQSPAPEPPSPRPDRDRTARPRLRWSLVGREGPRGRGLRGSFVRPAN